MPYSSLVYRDASPESAQAQATVIALHGNHGHIDDVVPIAQAIAPDLRIIAPEAARGLYRVRDLVSHSWYGGTQIVRPDPASFGDSLAQIERFIHDVRDRDDTDGEALPWLLGYEQGAVLALSLAFVAPDLVRGVMAICGGLPTFSNPRLLQPVASDLPVLFIGDHSNQSSEEAGIDATKSQLEQLGNRVTVRWVDDAARLGKPVTHELQNWMKEQHQ